MTVPGMVYVLEIVRSTSRRGRRQARPEVLWLPSTVASPTTVWAGTHQEFAHAFRTGVMVTDRAGLVVNLAGITADLEKATGETVT